MVIDGGVFFIGDKVRFIELEVAIVIWLFCIKCNSELIKFGIVNFNYREEFGLGL